MVPPRLCGVRIGSRTPSGSWSLGFVPSVSVAFFEEERGTRFMAQGSVSVWICSHGV